MAGSASNYHHGEMDVSEQLRTFHTIMVITKWACVGLAALLALLVIWFCTNAGFFTAVATGLVILVVGILVLRERRTPAH
jgi:hypothetical protein